MRGWIDRSAASPLAKLASFGTLEPADFARRQAAFGDKFGKVAMQGAKFLWYIYGFHIDVIVMFYC